MAIYNKEIVDSIASQDNACRLESIISREFKEWNALPWKIRWLEQGKKIRKQANAEKILKEAKQEVDAFIGESYAVDIPSLKRKNSVSFEKIPASSYISNALFIGAGIFLGYQGNKSGSRDMAMIGGLMAGIGISKLAFLMSLRTNCNLPGYNPETNEIIWLREKRNNLKLDMLHEYSHAVAMPILGKQPLYMIVNEGFAEGVSNCIMKKSAVPAELKSGLFRSISFLHIAKHRLHRKNKGTDDFASLLDKLAKNELMRVKEIMLAKSIGYAFFRLAEEKRGESVYREALEGKYENLFC